MDDLVWEVCREFEEEWEDGVYDAFSTNLVIALFLEPAASLFGGLY